MSQQVVVFLIPLTGLIFLRGGGGGGEKSSEFSSMW